MFSRHCQLCLGPSDSHSDICSACQAELPWLGSHCAQCALPLHDTSPGTLCGQCLQQPPAFRQVIAPFTYRFPLDSLIPAFKYHNQLASGRLLVPALIQAIQHHHNEYDQALPERLLPMPLHRQRQAQRGYNQAFELARPVARALGIQLDRHSLLRRQSTPAQQGLSANERRRNLQDAFHCPQPEQIHGLHLAVLDDVVTTGATANEVSRTLLKAGAASISIWALARTP
nr:ComF family protein [Halopseudomonas salegens]